MRGRKHPLEVFRSNGREFVTRREDLERNESEAVPRTRRSWDARVPREPVRTAVAPVPVAESPPRRSVPLLRVAAVLAGLVLLVGTTYALRLWPFAPEGAEGTGPSPLQRIQSIWRDPTIEPPADPAASSSQQDGEKAIDRNASGGGAGSKEATAAKARQDVEYWVVAASVKLTPEMKKNDAWKERFKPDQQRLERALGKEFPTVKTQRCYADAKHDDVLLRLGPAAAADEPTLVRVLARVRALGGSFKDATIKAFRKP